MCGTKSSHLFMNEVLERISVHDEHFIQPVEHRVWSDHRVSVQIHPVSQATRWTRAPLLVLIARLTFGREVTEPSVWEEAITEGGLDILLPDIEYVCEIGDILGGGLGLGVEEGGDVPLVSADLGGDVGEREGPLGLGLVQKRKDGREGRQDVTGA